METRGWTLGSPIIKGSNSLFPHRNVLHLYVPQLPVSGTSVRRIELNTDLRIDRDTKTHSVNGRDPESEECTS